jgi:hypothetical protein
MVIHSFWYCIDAAVSSPNLLAKCGGGGEPVLLMLVVDGTQKSMSYLCIMHFAMEFVSIIGKKQ